jgi:hypothetical protein
MKAVFQRLFYSGRPPEKHIFNVAARHMMPP